MDTEFFRDLDRFSLLVKKRVASPYSGGRRSMRFGRGISPVGYREYRKGDEFKLVDWKVYGRTEKLYVREHEEERSLVVHILLDASGSMAYDDKFPYASKIAAGLAYLAAKENEKYAVSFFSEEFHPGEPRRGKKYLFRTVDELDRTVPRDGTDLKIAAEQFAAMITSTSLVVVISDLLEETEDVVSSIYRLSKHDLVVIQVLSPSETDLDFKGDVKFVDMETGEGLVTRIDAALKDEYQARMQNHIARIAEACKNAGADFFSFRTDRPVFDAFSDLNTRSKAWRGL